MMQTPPANLAAHMFEPQQQWKVWRSAHRDLVR
jgi:hypothetical protein